MCLCASEFLSSLPCSKFNSCLLWCGTFPLTNRFSANELSLLYLLWALITNRILLASLFRHHSLKPDSHHDTIMFALLANWCLHSLFTLFAISLVCFEVFEVKVSPVSSDRWPSKGKQPFLAAVDHTWLHYFFKYYPSVVQWIEDKWLISVAVSV